MKKWILKAIVQKTISFLPYSHSINFLFQKYVTKGVYLSDEYFFDRLGHARSHLHAYLKYSGNKTPETCLEIGTGWYPVVPVSFFLTGSEKIYSVDISFLTSKERLLTTLEKFRESYVNGSLKDYVDLLPERYQKVQDILNGSANLSLEQMLEMLYISYLIEDARNLSLESNSIDLVNSNNTFEHIYPQILMPILAEFKRVLKKNDGVMSHFIDMSDHFAHFDKSISIYNFLKFSDNQWRWIDNSIQPQNRLRFYEYKSIYQKLEIPITEESFRPGNPDELKEIKVNEKYLQMSVEETAISHCHFISIGIFK